MSVSNRVFWGGVCIVCSAVLSGSLVAQGVIQPLVRTQRIEIVDAGGTLRAEIGARPDGTVYANGLSELVAQAAVAGNNAAVGALNTAATPVSGAKVESLNQITDMRIKRDSVYEGKEPSATEAYEMAARFARPLTKDPASAEFAAYDAKLVEKSPAGSRYTVYLPLHAGNSLGLRSNAALVVLIRYAVGYWRIDKFTYGPN